MRIEPFVQEGYELLHQGVIELARVEANGIRIDVPRLSRTKAELDTIIRDARKDIEKNDIWKLWRKRYGAKANITSHDQLGSLLYGEMGFPVTDYTEAGKPSTDEEALQKIDHPAIPQLLRLAGFQKARGTYLKGIEREIVGDRIHPVFNLHTARTYRSSSNDPNFQNFPVRDKEVAKIIRSHFIASKGCVLTENDFKGVEVSVSACYHKDQNFISYITTPGKDMHRDMAAQLYMLKPKEVSKDARYGAKNKFVFPQFYGDFYISCTKALWDWIERGKLTGPDGKSLFEHLAAKGITERGLCDPEKDPGDDTFEHHVQSVENDFWNNRFKGYGKWRRDWYAEYLEKGYFDLLSGFRVYGSFRRNAVVNYPVQGAAFHCLLWTLIQVNRRLRKYQMKSKVVGQIHDSLIGDVRVEELRDYLSIVEEVVNVDILKFYKWLIIPLEVETEIAPPSGTWYDKREVKFKQGRFTHPLNPEKFTTDPHKFCQMIDSLLHTP